MPSSLVLPWSETKHFQACQSVHPSARQHSFYQSANKSAKPSINQSANRTSALRDKRIRLTEKLSRIDQDRKSSLQIRRPSSIIDRDEIKKLKIKEKGARDQKKEKQSEHSIRNRELERICEDRSRVQIQIPSWREEGGKGEDWRRMKGDIEDTSDKVLIHTVNILMTMQLINLSYNLHIMTLENLKIAKFS